MLFSILFIGLINSVILYPTKVSTDNVVSLITVGNTYITLVISILKIIINYVFPQKEEEYITRIVEMIQANDLDNTKENISAINRTE